MRFYMPADEAADLLPPFGSVWTVTDTPTVGVLSTTKTAGANVTTRKSRPGIVLCGQFVSAPLAAGEISGSLSALFVGSENFSSANAKLVLAVRLVSSTGAEKAVLYANSAIDAEFPSSDVWGVRGVEDAAVSMVAVADGDRLVVEAGHAGGGVSSHTAALRFGAQAGTADLTRATASADMPNFSAWVDVPYSIAGAPVTVAGSAWDAPSTWLDGTAVGTSRPYAGAVLADSPLVYWRMGESSGTAVGDSSSHGRTATFSVGTYTRGVDGLLISESDKATLFPKNSKAGIAFASWMQQPTFTAEALVKPTAISGEQLIVGRNDTNGTSGAGYQNMSWRLLIEATGKPRLDLMTGQFTGVSVTGSTALTAGQTYHIAATYDGSTMRVYVNGVLDGSQARSGGFQSSATCPMSIGSYAGFGSGAGGRDFFNGVIDEVAFYAGALSDTRIAAHYAAATAATISVPGTPWVASATWLEGAPQTPLRVLGETWEVPAVWLDGAIPVNHPVVVAGEAWAVPVALLDGTLALRVPGEAWAAPATWLNGAFVGLPLVIEGEAWQAVATWLDGSRVYATDLLSDVSEGYNYDGESDVLDDGSTGSIPAGIRVAPIRIVHQSVPAPVLVKGRPQ